MVYTRPAHGDPGNDGSATDAVVIIDALSDGVEALESGSALGVFHVGNYGTVDLTGASDSSAAVIAALAACYAAGGGIVLFPRGTIRCDSQLVIPNTGTGGKWYQPDMILRGLGSRWDNYGADMNTGGTRLDLRYSGSDAKIVTLGGGHLRFEHMLITDLGTSSTAFVLTTNTRITTRNLGISGNPSKSVETCDQDGFILGGTAAAEGNLVTSGFQGYGTVIEGVVFSHIRRALYARVWCNSVVFQNNMIDVTCGSGDETPAIEVDSTVGFAWGNVISGNLIQINGYQYGITFRNARYNSGFGNSFWDSDASLVALIRLVGSSSSNRIEGTFRIGVPDSKVLEAGSSLLFYSDEAGTNRTVITGDSIDSNTGPLHVQPSVAQAGDAYALLSVTRSALEGVNPSTSVFKVSNAGDVTAKTSIGISGLGIGASGLVKSSGNLPLYAGSSTSTIIATRGYYRDMVSTTAGRQSAATMGSGACYFDTTLNKPVWSDGTNWRDAAGNTV